MGKVGPIVLMLLSLAVAFFFYPWWWKLLRVKEDRGLYLGLFLILLPGAAGLFYFIYICLLTIFGN